ncbi:MAG: RNA pseudouridine synthase [Planctomycetota bacterium]
MIEIIFQHPDFVVVSKPPHRLIASSKKIPELPLNRELEQQLGQRLWTVHRLDRETSGLVLFALNADAQRILSRLFENHLIQKTYLALCWGSPTPSENTVSLPLRNGRKNLMRICQGKEEGLKAETHFRVLKSSESFSLLQIEPKTGRQHQIRVHLAAIGHPALGDTDYYPTARVLAGFKQPTWDAERVLLHASRLQFVWQEKPMNFECPLPADFLKISERLDSQKGSG